MSKQQKIEVCAASNKAALAGRPTGADFRSAPLVGSLRQASPRVMHVITGVGQGGAEKMLSDIIARRPEGSEHSVLSLTAGEPFFHFGPRFASLGLRRGEISPRGLWQLRSAIIAFKPDVLHSWLYHANLATSLAAPVGATQVWGIHNTDLPSGGAKQLTRLTARLCGLLSHIVPSRIIYCSAAAASWHQGVLGYASRYAGVIENGIDFNAFAFDPAARARLRAQWGLGEADLAIGSIGRFSPQKGHATVAGALRHLSARQVTWVLAGEGCVAENHDLSILRQGLRSLALGPRRDVVAVLSALDLLVIGSAFGEALPVVGLEAVANGLPVVTTRVGDAALLVAIPAQLADPKDVSDLVRAISSALSLRRGGPELEALRRGLLARCDISIAAEAYHCLYAEATNAKRRRRSEQACGSRGGRAKV